MKKLRIALVTANYNIVQDGVSLTLNRLVGYLLENGHTVKIFAPVVENPQIKHIGEIIPVDSFPFPGREEYMVSKGLNRDAEEQMIDFRPHIIHITTPDILGCQALLFGLRRNIPVVTSYHTHFLSYGSYYNLEIFRRMATSYMLWFHRNCVHTYVPSESTAEVIREVGVNRGIRIWARGIDTQRFEPGKRDLVWRRSLGIGDDDLAVCFVSRLVMEKELDTLARTFVELHQKNSRIRTVIVGDGPARAELEKMLPQTIFTGFLDGDELPKAYASCDIFMFPSISETFGNVTLEAMACRLPVVAAEAQGNSSLVLDGKNGFLVPPRNVAAFRDAILRLAEDDILRNSMADAALKFSESFTWDEVLGKLVSYYTEAMESRDIPAN